MKRLTFDRKRWGPLLDHLVGPPEQGNRESAAEGPCGLHVYDQLVFVACWTGRSAGFSPFN